MNWQNDLQGKSNSRQVTERDLRLPEFRDAKLEDLEFRGDDKIVRKDRWETSLRQIAGYVVGSRSKFECEQVVEAVRELIGREWATIPLHEDFDSDYYPTDGSVVEVKLEDCSVLRNVTYRLVQPPKGAPSPTWKWAGEHVPVQVAAWREQALDQEQEA